MVAYIGLSPAFYDDEALRPWLNMACDPKAAEKEGIRAVIFGKDRL